MTAIQYNVNAPEAAQLLADEWNADLPTAGTSLLTDDIEITGSGRIAYMNIGFSSSVSAILSVKRTRTAVSRIHQLNGGSSIAVGALHQETIYVVPGETIQLVYGDNGGKYELVIGAVVQNG